jgi:hypothetical protein
MGRWGDGETIDYNHSLIQTHEAKRNFFTHRQANTEGVWGFPSRFGLQKPDTHKLNRIDNIMIFNPVNITVNIEKLILTGITIPPAHHPLIQAAIEAELTNLLTTQGLAPDFTISRTTPQLPISTFTLTPHLSLTQLGHQIAHAVYQSIAP